MKYWHFDVKLTQNKSQAYWDTGIISHKIDYFLLGEFMVLAQLTLNEFFILLQTPQIFESWITD